MSLCWIRKGFLSMWSIDKSRWTSGQRTHRRKVILNYPEEKPRVRLFVSFEPDPAVVYKVEGYFGSFINPSGVICCPYASLVQKLGRFRLCTQKFNEQLKFYTSNLNILPT